MLYPTPSTAPDCTGEQRRFRVTHPFHPLFGEEFELFMYRVAWGEERVYFYDAEGQQKRLPAAWTDVIEPEPFVVVSAGRSLFRVSDLIELRRFLDLVSEADSPVSPEMDVK